MVFKTDYHLMQVKSIAECSKVKHSAILSTFIKLPSVIKIFVLSILSGCLRQVLFYIRRCCLRIFFVVFALMAILLKGGKILGNLCRRPLLGIHE